MGNPSQISGQAPQPSKGQRRKPRKPRYRKAARQAKKAGSALLNALVPGNPF